MGWSVQRRKYRTTSAAACPIRDGVLTRWTARVSTLHYTVDQERIMPLLVSVDPLFFWLHLAVFFVFFSCCLRLTPPDQSFRFLTLLLHLAHQCRPETSL